jgi:hypothetical protein
MKQMNLMSNLDTSKVKRNVVDTEPNRNERSAKESNEKQINEVPAVPLTQSKAKKLMNLAGNTGEAFSKSNIYLFILLDENQDREVQEFKVEANKGFQLVEPKQLKSLFAKNG